MNVVEGAGVDHLVLIYLSLFNQNIIETDSFLTGYAAAHIFVGTLLNTLINWYSRQLLAKHHGISNVLVIGEVVQDGT